MRVTAPRRHWPPPTRIGSSRRPSRSPALYFFLFEPLGFVLSSSAYLFAMTMYFNRGQTVANALVSFLLPISCYLVFTRVLGVELAPGILPI